MQCNATCPVFGMHETKLEKLDDPGRRRGSMEANELHESISPFRRPQAQPGSRVTVCLVSIYTTRQNATPTEDVFALQTMYWMIVLD